ncbi:endolytic transglycosylase MltG [Treponema sp. OMZ 840]|uniref:endolytic transglycosylase MltG n=1 Tax=Treponema sp. OMZ 840 TaxID=244313 RepID=UPI003D8EE802
MKNKKKNKKYTVLCAILLLICIPAAAYALYAYHAFVPLLAASDKSTDSNKSDASDTGTETDEYRMIVASGATLRTVARDLKAQGIIRSADFFYLYGRFKRIFLKAGIYKINGGMSVSEICALLQSGRQEYISVALAEGLTLRKIAEILEKNGVTSAQDFIQAAHKTDLLNEFGIPAASFEGYLFPDTYNFDYGMNAEKVVRLLANNFFTKIRSLSELNDKNNQTAQDLHNIVILASIIEREYRIPEEAPLIASVFVNRLKKNIGLYSCATLVYILTEIEGREHPELIKIEDTKIDNPYNTYKWAGLPPGPISNPGLTALKAAAAPPKTSYYYFRLTDSTKGSHIFTENFDSHKEAAPIPTKRTAQ